MEVLTIIGGILLAVASVLLIILVLMQDSKQPGLNGLTGTTDSYLSKNKSRTLESRLVFATKILVVVLFVLAIGVNLIVRFMD